MLKLKTIYMKSFAVVQFMEVQVKLGIEEFPEWNEFSSGDWNSSGLSPASVVKLNEDYEVSDDLTHDLQNNTNMNFNGFPFHLLLILVRVAHPQIDFFPKYNNIPKVNLDWV